MISTNDEFGTRSKPISLNQKIEFLKNPDNYPEPCSTVETIKTHMAWVFLTDNFVYKLKKPFRYNHTGLKTPEARRMNCLDEVRLNRRLAPDIYLGVIPLSVDKNGNLNFKKEYKIVDWLVKMKRLPADMLLHHRIKSGKKITVEELKASADLLTRFYITAEPFFFSSGEYQIRLIRYLYDYRQELLKPEFELPKQLINDIYHAQVAYIRAHRSTFDNRIEMGRIVEGHGDLKPEHICLSPTVIIDCLEFDKDLRIMDVIEDLSFLAVECDRLGASWIGKYILEYYMNEANDPVPESLIAFYKSYKALIRALLSIRHIMELPYKHETKWKEKAGIYLELASKYIL